MCKQREGERERERQKDGRRGDEERNKLREMEMEIIKD